jgi:penicillin amidase
VRILSGWDFVLSTDSMAAAIYEVWVAELRKELQARYAGAGGEPIPDLPLPVLVRSLASPDEAFGEDPAAGRDGVLVQCLARAIARLEQVLGPDRAAWRWGRLHQVAIGHVLSAAAGAARPPTLDVAPLPVGGDAFTVHNTAFRESDFRQTSGASYRQVLDVGDWDRSTALNSPGQSGDPRSPHYRDLFAPAVEGRYVPMLYGREAVMEAAETVITLEPASP